MKPANKKRAARLKKLIKGYAGDPFGDLKTDVIDVLADIRHLCQAHGLNYGVLEADAFDHYIAERGE